jgi:hypothetical protein
MNDPDADKVAEVFPQLELVRNAIFFSQALVFLR